MLCSEAKGELDPVLYFPNSWDHKHAATAWFMQHWGWNLDLCVCRASTLPAELHAQPFLLACHHSNLKAGLRTWAVFLLGPMATLAESMNEQSLLTLTGQKAEHQLPARRTGQGEERGSLALSPAGIAGCPDPRRGSPDSGRRRPRGPGELAISRAALYLS